MTKNVKRLLIAFWILVLGLFVVFLLYSPWQIFANEQYGFQVRFPSDFILEDTYDGDFSIEDKNGIEYFSLRIYKKPKDYKEPSGPFPMEEKSEFSASDITRLTFNGIQGFRSSGNIEGGGGSFDTFYFVRGEDIWYIDLDPLLKICGDFLPHPECAKNFNEKIFQRISDSFKLTK